MRPLMFGIVLLLCGLPAFGQKMTYDEAKAKLRPDRKLPNWWVATADELPGRWAKVAKGKVEEIAKSPGGRPLHLISYGEPEKLPQKANFNSALGGRDPKSYRDKAARRKPVVYFVGPVHGHEVEGLIGLASLIAVVETGRDLRGQPQPKLAELAAQCRLLIVPCGNPDGLARFEPRAIHGMNLSEFQFWAMGTWRDDSIAFWPGSKRQHPRVGPEIGWLGCYFNDKGINPMHDEFLAPMSSEAPAILRVARDQAPDLAVSLHSHESPTAVLPAAYVSLEVKHTIRALAEQVYTLFDERKLPHGILPAVREDEDKKFDCFNLTSALYHISGATAFTFECPHGVDEPKACKVSLEDTLDIELALYEAMLWFALEGKK